MSIRKFYMLLSVLLLAGAAYGGGSRSGGVRMVLADTIPVTVNRLPANLLALPNTLSSGSGTRSGDLFRGGQDDGFAASCLPPLVIEHGQQEFRCIEDSIVMWIKAVGTDMTYKWQKYDARDFRDLDETADYVSGVNTERLVLRAPQKSRDDGIYRCLVSNGCGDTPSDTFRVEMNTAPRLLVSLKEGMTWECIGAAGRNLAVVVESSDGNAVQYTWWKIDTTTGERTLFDPEKYNKSTITVKPTSREDEGIYGVKATNECGSVTDSVFMPVYMPVTVEEINIQDRKIVACEGESVDFRVKVAGGGVYQYALKKVEVTNNHPLVYRVLETVATGRSQVTLDVVSMGMAGKYVWEVENNCGRDTSQVFELVVHKLPDYTKGYEFPDTLACEGSELVLNCEAEGINVEYDWYHNGEITGITGNTFPIDNLREEDAGIYVCFAHNVCSRQVQSRAIHVKMDPLPKILRDPLLLKPVCVGDSVVEINVRFGDAPLDSLRWKYNANYLYDIPNKIDGSTENKLSIYRISYEEIGLYYVQAYNHCGSVISKPAQLEINQPARIIKGLEGYEMLLCAGEDQQLAIKAEGATPIRYRWLCNDLVIAESEENVVHIQSGEVNEHAQYSVQVENMCGGESQSMSLKVARIEPFKLEGGGEYCDGQDATGAFNMIGSDTNTIYTLYKDPEIKMEELKGTGDTLKFEHVESGVYYITGTDTNGCVQRMKNPVEVVLKKSPEPGRLILLNQSCQNNPGANVLMTNWEENIQYKLYRKYDTEEWEWYKYMMFLGGNERMGSPAPGEKKIWEGLGEGRYKVVAQDLLNGCTREMELPDSVVLRPAPRRYTLFAPHDDYVNCSLEAELTQLEADAYESGSTYVLKKDGEPYGQALKYSPIRWSQINQGEYTLLVKNEWGCESESKPVTIINSNSPAQLRIGGNGSICNDDPSPYKELILEGAEAGVTYRIYQDFPERFVEEVRGTGNDISVIVPASNATYVVDAYDATGKCKVRLEDRFMVAASDFQAVTNPGEIFLDRGGRTRLHVAVDGTYAQPMAIEWKPKQMIEWGLVNTPTTQWHKQYYVPFCPCRCPARGSNYHQYSHGPQCLEHPASCPYLYHAWDPKEHGCVYQGTERIQYEGRMVPYYDLYFCAKQIDDDYQIDHEEEGVDNPFSDPLTVPVYNDQMFVVTATDGLGCSRTDSVKVKVTGKKLDAEIIFSQEHKHYYVPFCPCGCSLYGGGRHSTHGPGCNDSNCWLFYHSHKHEGCTFQKTEKIMYEGQMRNYYDLYYCCTGVEASDTIVYRNDELFFCSEASGGDYNFKYTWSFVTADGIATVFTDATDHVKFKARESGYLYMDVTSMGQHKKDSIWIEVIRRPLAAEIRNSECEIRLDSVWLCRGERIELCGWAEGGDAEHIYRWFDDEHDLASVNHVVYKPDKSRYVWFLTSSDGVEVLDSVFISLSPSPLKVDIEDPGVRCVQLDQEEIIRVPHPQQGMNYVLEFRPPGESNREAGQRFTQTTGDPLVFSVDNPVVNAGMYKVRVDTIIGDKVCSTYLDSVEFIRPPSDAQLVDTTYCFGDFGVALQLKSVADSIKYSILSSKGTVLETISKPQTQFKKLFTQASYFLRTERVGEMGSCWKDRRINVARAPDPDVSLEVVANAHGPVCEGSEITITVMGTEKDVKYELISPQDRVEDGFIGTGGDVSFTSFPRPAGLYMIRATRGNCDVYLDNSIRVNALPRNIDLKDIHYCYTPPTRPTEVKVPIEMSGLQDNVRYYLRNKGHALDSIEGPGTKSFGLEVSDGQYEILARDLATQCVSPVNVVDVVADEGPYPFPLLGGCGARQEVRIAASQKRVTYELYRDNVQCGTVAGTGDELSFGEQTVSGVYTVWAQNDTSLCRSKMLGSVSVYELDTCALEVVGSICRVGGDGSVELHYPCSKSGWSYFIAKVNGTIRERGSIYDGTGGELWWDRINGKALKEGNYELWACNACDTIKVTSVEVIKRDGPKGRIMPMGNACRDQQVEVVVTGGSPDLVYTLSAELGGFQKELNKKEGSGDNFSMGRYANYTMYRLSASYPDGSCSKMISTALVRELSTPTPLEVIGADVCKKLNGGVEEGEIALCLPSRESQVEYYLLQEDAKHRVDSIKLTDSRTCFKAQEDVGCYYVWGRNAQTNCQDTMTGLFCLGGVPSAFPLYVDDMLGGTTLKEMCIDETCKLLLHGSEKGVRYQLYRDKTIAVGKPLSGTGAMLVFDGITEQGTYSVIASNGCDSREMENTIEVRVGDIPDIGIDNPYHYCPDKKGATITVSGTERGSVFKLYEQNEWANVLLETQTSAESGQTVTFDTLLTERKRYLINVRTRYGCEVEQEFQVKKDTLPDVSFELRSTTDSVICEDSCTELFLTGSEKNVDYFLYNEAGEEFGYLLGDGNPLPFGKICEGGSYHVIAARHYRPYCSARIEGEIRLQNIDTIRNLSLTVNRNYYCFGESDKAVISVANAQRGVTYQLYRNGRPTEDKIRPNADGTTIKFEGVDGGTCETPNEYTVMASKGKCSKFMLNSVRVVAENPVDESALKFTPERNIECCEGDTIALTAFAEGCNMRYHWYLDGNMLPETGSYLKLFKVKAEQKGLYSCEVENACQPPVTVGRVNVKITPKPVIRENIKSISLCEGKSAYLYSMIDNVHTGNYRWYRTDDGKDEVYSTSPFLEFEKVTRADAGEYVCEGSSTCEVVRDTFMVYVDVDADSLRIAKLTDTLCVGAAFGATIEPLVPFDKVTWKFNGVSTGVQGYTYTISNIAMKDDGIYSVAVNNACGEKEITVKQLIVDDSVKVFDITPDQLSCANLPMDFYIKTIPSMRVDYTWYQGSSYLGKGEKITALVGEGETERTFRVYYSNACGIKWADVNVSISAAIRVVNPPKQVLLCADPTASETICADVENVDVYSYQWFYQPKNSSRIDSLGKEKCETIQAQTNRTGFYWCKMETECRPISSTATWFKVDTVPVISGLPERDTLCMMGTYEYTVQGSGGGGLVYDWQARLKDGSIEKLMRGEGEEFLSSSTCRVGPVTEAWDSAVIICSVNNGCGRDSMKMLLRVEKARELVVQPNPDTTVCEGGYAHIRVELKNGTYPWFYRYRDSVGREEARTVSSGLVDEFDLDRPGKYQILFIRDGQSCNYAEGDLNFEIKSHPAPVARIEVVGHDTLCPGEKGQLRVVISYPSLKGQPIPAGPWEVKFIRRDGSAADELGVSSPYYIYKQSDADTVVIDTLRPFGLAKAMAYYIGSVKDMGEFTGVQCGGQPMDSAVFHILARDTLRFDFRSEKDTLGYCNSVLLDTLLRPNMDGDFYIDGIKSQLGIFNSPPLEPGRHIIKYRTNGQCPMSNDSVRLVVMPKPELKIVPRDTALCPGQSVMVNMDAIGSKPMEIKYELRNIKRDGSLLPKPENLVVVPPKSIKVSNSSTDDSLRILTPMYLIDRFGCWADRVDTIQAKVEMLKNPEFKVYGRHKNYNDGDWADWYDSYIIPKGDSVEFKVVLESGRAPWVFTLIQSGKDPVDVGPVYASDTIIKEPEEGQYQFTVSDCYSCSKPGDQEVRNIFYREPGYLRIKVLLEGAYSEADPVYPMHGKLQKYNLLPKRGLTAWPVTGKDSIVDWVTVETRETVDGPSVSSDTFLLRNDGMLITVKGSDTLALQNSTKLWGSEQMYVIVKHRNHISVISRNPVSVVDLEHKKDVKTLDLTKEANLYFPAGSNLELHAQKLKNNLWGMAAGYDLHDSGSEFFPDNHLVSISNPNTAKFAGEKEIQATYRGYYWRDVNLDGIVEWPDDITPGDDVFSETYKTLFKSRDAWILHKNRNKYSAVPLKK